MFKMWKSVKSFFRFFGWKTLEFFPVYVRHKNIGKSFLMLNPKGIFFVWILNKHGMGN